MSTMEIKLLKNEEGIVDSIELQNAHGGCIVIWDQVAVKYLNKKPFQYFTCTEEIWPLWKNKNLPEHHRAVLGITYDNALVLKEHFLRAASDIEKYLEDFPIDKNYVNHWEEILKVFKSNPNCEAIGFYWTSVGEDPFLGEYNEKTEDYEKLSWEKFWSVYHVLDRNSNSL